MIKLSLVIPCYNEAESLPGLLERCKLITAQQGCEVIIVDNGSTDTTPDILNKLVSDIPGCRSIRVEKNQGYGFGIVEGLRSAKGDVLAWTHADLQTDPYDVIRGLGHFNSNAEDVFVKGKRYGRSIVDSFFTICMSTFETLLLKKKMCDINAQPTMFHRVFFEKWVKDYPYDFSLDLYVYYLAKASGLQFFRFPVFFGKRVHGYSHWNISFTGRYRFIMRTIRYSLKLKSAFLS